MVLCTTRFTYQKSRLLYQDKLLSSWVIFSACFLWNSTIRERTAGSLNPRIFAASRAALAGSSTTAGAMPDGCAETNKYQPR